MERSNNIKNKQNMEYIMLIAILLMGSYRTIIDYHPIGRRYASLHIGKHGKPNPLTVGVSEKRMRHIIMQMATACSQCSGIIHYIPYHYHLHRLLMTLTT